MRAKLVCAFIALLAVSAEGRSLNYKSATSGGTSSSVSYNDLQSQTLQTIMAAKGYSSVSNSASSELSAKSHGKICIGYSVNAANTPKGRKLSFSEALVTNPTSAQITLVEEYLQAFVLQAEKKVGCFIPRSAVAASGLRNLGDGSSAWDVVILKEKLSVCPADGPTAPCTHRVVSDPNPAADSCTTKLVNFLKGDSPYAVSPLMFEFGYSAITIDGTLVEGVVTEDEEDIFPSDDVSKSEWRALLAQTLTKYTSDVFNWAGVVGVTIYQYSGSAIGFSTLPTQPPTTPVPTTPAPCSCPCPYPSSFCV
jgi:hypothetical protein